MLHVSRDRNRIHFTEPDGTFVPASFERNDNLLHSLPASFVSTTFAVLILCLLICETAYHSIPSVRHMAAIYSLGLPVGL